MRFVLGRHYRALEDPALTRLGGILFVVFWAYTAVFAALLAAVVSLFR